MPRSARTPDAIALLKADHRNVEELFERFETTNGKVSKSRIAQQVSRRFSRALPTTTSTTRRSRCSRR